MKNKEFKKSICGSNGIQSFSNQFFGFGVRGFCGK